MAAEQKGRGIDPIPPPLVTAANNWTDPQLYWIVSHGLKDSGMPAFGVRLSENDRWAVVGFLRILVFLSLREYKQLTAESGSGAGEQWRRLSSEAAHGFGQLSAEGNPNRGNNCWIITVARDATQFPSLDRAWRAHL